MKNSALLPLTRPNHQNTLATRAVPMPEAINIDFPEPPEKLSIGLLWMGRIRMPVFRLIHPPLFTIIHPPIPRPA